jgi:hypothetical protein
MGLQPEARALMRGDCRAPRTAFDKHAGALRFRELGRPRWRPASRDARRPDA